MTRILLCALLACAGLLACSPGVQESPYGNVSGTIFDTADNPFTFGTVVEADTVQYTGPACTGGAQQSELAMTLSTRSGYCAAIQAGAGLGSTGVLQLSIIGTAAVSGGAPPLLGTASYAIGSRVTDAEGNFYDVGVTFAIFDGACSQQDLFAVSGNIIINSLNAGEAQGTFTADFGDDANSSGAGGTLTGDFDSFPCEVAPAELCAGTAGGCAH